MSKRYTAKNWLKQRRKSVGYVMHKEEEPEAEWINNGSWVVCSRCGCSAETQYDGVQPVPKATKYCPDCGALMEFNYVW